MRGKMQAISHGDDCHTSGLQRRWMLESRRTFRKAAQSRPSRFGPLAPLTTHFGADFWRAARPAMRAVMAFIWSAHAASLACL